MAINGGRINFEIGYTVDKTALQQLSTSLSNISKIGQNNSNFKMTSQINEAVNAAKSLNVILSQATTKEGTLNVTKFNALLNQSGQTLAGYKTKLEQAGLQGTIAFNKMNNALMTAEVTMTKTEGILSKTLTTFGKTAVWGMANRAFNSIIGSVQSAVSYVEDLDQSLNDIRIVTKASADEMETFAEKANKAAKQLAVSTTDYTKASLIYYQQGLSGNEVTQRANVTSKVANVTGQDTSTVSEHLTAVWNGYKVGAEDVETSIDKLAAVAANSASSLSELSEAMSKVASAANEMGVSEDQLTAQISTIISTTRQDPSSVGTALKTIYARMGDLQVNGEDDSGVSLGDVSGTLKELGIDVLDTSGNLRDMGTVMEEVEEKWQDWTQAQRQAAAVAMAGKRQYNNLIALFSNWNTYTENLEVAQGSAGEIEKQNEVYLDSIDAKSEQLTAHLQTLYSDILPTDIIKDAYDLGSNFVDVFTNMLTPLGKANSFFTSWSMVLLGISGILKDKIGKSLSDIILKGTKQEQQARNIKTVEESVALTKSNQSKILGEQNNYLSNGQLMGSGIEAYGEEEKGKTIANMKAEMLKIQTQLTEEEQKELNIQIEETGNLSKQNAELKQRVLNQGRIRNKQYNNNTTNLKTELVESQRAEAYAQANVNRYNSQVDSLERTAGGDPNDFYTQEAKRQLASIQPNAKKAVEELNEAKKRTAAIDTEIMELEERHNIDERTRLAIEKEDYDALVQIANELGAKWGQVDTEIINKENEIKDIKDQIAMADGEEKETLTYNLKVLEEELAELKTKQELLEEEEANVRNIYSQHKKIEASMLAQKKSLAETKLSGDVAKTFSSALSGLNSLVFGLTSLKSVWEAFTSDDMDIGDRITQGLMGITMGLPMVVSGIKSFKAVYDGIHDVPKDLANIDKATREMNDSNKMVTTSAEEEIVVEGELTEANTQEATTEGAQAEANITTTGTEAPVIAGEEAESAQDIVNTETNTQEATTEGAQAEVNGYTTLSAWKKVLGSNSVFKTAFSLAFAALAAVGVSALINALDDQFNKKQKNIEDIITDNLEEITTSISTSESYFTNLISSLDELKSKKDSLEELTVGTEDWKNALNEVNNSITDILKQYPVLKNAVDFDKESGALTISDSNIEQAKINAQKEQNINSGISSLVDLASTKSELDALNQDIQGTQSSGITGAGIGEGIASVAGGAAAGAAAAALTGAMLGSVVPGIGTAIGAGVGAIVGAIASYSMNDTIQDSVNSMGESIHEIAESQEEANEEQQEYNKKQLEYDKQLYSASLSIASNLISDDDVYQDSDNKEYLTRGAAAYEREHYDEYVEEALSTIQGLTGSDLDDVFQEYADSEGYTYNSSKRNNLSQAFTDSDGKVVENISASGIYAYIASKRALDRIDDEIISKEADWDRELSAADDTMPQGWTDEQKAAYKAAITGDYTLLGSLRVDKDTLLGMAERLGIDDNSEEWSKIISYARTAFNESVTTAEDKISNTLGSNPDKKWDETVSVKDIEDELWNSGKEIDWSVFDEDELEQILVNSIEEGSAVNSSKTIWRATETALELYQNHRYEIFKKSASDYGKDLDSIEENLISGELTSANASQNETWNTMKGQMETIKELYPQLTAQANTFCESALIGTKEYEEAVQDLQAAMYDLAIDYAENNFTDEVEDLEINIDTDSFEEQIEDILSSEHEVIVDLKAETDDSFDDAVTDIKEIQDAADKIGENYTVAGEDIASVEEAFPGILENAKLLADGTIQLNDDVAKQVTKNQTELEKQDIQKTIKELENKKSIADANVALYTDMADIANQASQNEIDRAIAEQEIKNKLKNVQKDESLDLTETDLNNEIAVAEQARESAKTYFDNWQEAYQKVVKMSADAATKQKNNNEYVSGDSESVETDLSAQYNYKGSSENTEEDESSNPSQITTDNVSDVENWADASTYFTNEAALWKNYSESLTGQIAELTSRMTGLDYSLDNLGKGDEDGDELDKIEEEIDAYYKINRELSLMENKLSLLQKQNEMTFGTDKLKNYDKQIKALTVSYEDHNEKLKIAQKEAQKYRNSLSADGTKFDKNGVISNYGEMIVKYTQEINSAVSEEEQEAAQQRYDDWQDWVEKYDEAIDTALEEEEEKLNAIADRTEAIINKHTYKITIQTEYKEATQNANDYNRKVDYTDDDYLSINKSYLSDYNSNSSEITQRLKNIQAYRKMLFTGKDEKGKTIDREQVKEQLQQEIDDLRQSGEDLQSTQETVANNVGSVIKSWQSEISDSEKDLSQLNSIVSHYADITKLIWGDDAYDKQQQYLDQQVNIAKASTQIKKDNLENLKSQKAGLESLLADAQKNGNTRLAAIYESQLKDLEDEIDTAESDFETSLKSTMDSMLAAYKNSINSIIQDFEENFFGTFGISGMKEEQDLVNKSSQAWLDTVQEVYQTNKINRTIEEEIANLNSESAKAKILNLQREITTELEKQDKLAQYDFDRATAQFNLLLKQIALEEAQENKSKMKLRRDSQGNYSYQYTADADEIAKAEEEAEEAAYNLNKLDQERLEEVESSITSLYSEMTEKIKKAESDYANDDVKRAEALSDIKDYYQTQMARYTEDYDIAKDNVADSSFDFVKDKFNLTASSVDDMTKEEKKSYYDMLFGTDGIVDLTTSGFDEMMQKIQGADGFDTVYKQLIEDCETENSDYQTSISDLASTFGSAYKSIIDGDDENPGLKQVKEKTKEVVNATQDIVDKYLGKNKKGGLLGAVEKVAKQITGSKTSLKERIDKVVNSYDTLLAKINAIIAAQSKLNKTATKTPSTTESYEHTLTDTTASSDSDTTDLPSSITKSKKYLNTVYNTKTGNYSVRYKEDGKTKIKTGFDSAEQAKIWVLKQGMFIKPRKDMIPQVGDSLTWRKNVDSLTYGLSQDFSQMGLLTSHNSSSLKIEKLLSYMNNQLALISWSDATGKAQRGYVYANYLKNYFKGFKTGGYTGDWSGSEGKLALLHQKELVLNAKDTENILSAVEAYRKSLNVLKYSNELSENSSAKAILSNIKNAYKDVKQSVTINADFSGVKNKEEIEAAFNSLVNKASQYAWNK